MTNKQKVQKMITEVSKELGRPFTLSGYDGTLEYLSDYQLKRIKEALLYGTSTDLRFRVKNITIVVEVSFMDNEIGFYAMDLAEHKELYGN